MHPVALPLVFIAGVSDVVPTSHASRVADYAIQPILVPGEPRILIPRLAVGSYCFYVCLVNLVDHKLIQCQDERELHSLRVLREPEGSMSKPFQVNDQVVLWRIDHQVTLQCLRSVLLLRSYR